MSSIEKPDDESVRAPKEGEVRPQAGQVPNDGHPVPLFLREGNEGRKGNAQDEKDEVGE
jgi:hypothetical protein